MLKVDDFWSEQTQKTPPFSKSHVPLRLISALKSEDGGEKHREGRDLGCQVPPFLFQAANNWSPQQRESPRPPMDAARPLWLSSASDELTPQKVLEYGRLLFHVMCSSNYLSFD